MTHERDEIVPAGTKVTHPNGQSLVVSDECAVGRSGVCYQTQVWADRRASNRAAWANRSFIRKALRMAPKGYYWNNHQRCASLFEGLFGSLFS